MEKLTNENLTLDDRIYRQTKHFNSNVYKFVYHMYKFKSFFNLSNDPFQIKYTEKLYHSDEFINMMECWKWCLPFLKLESKYVEDCISNKELEALENIFTYWNFDLKRCSKKCCKDLHYNIYLNFRNDFNKLYDLYI